MIIYFANRSMVILGRASTSISSDFTVKSDTKKEDVETGLSTYDCVIGYNDEDRLTLEEFLTPGNYILIGTDKGIDQKLHGVGSSVFEIVEEETNPSNNEITIYAEDVGMSLLGTIAPVYTNSSYKTIDFYLEYFLENSGFEVIVNDDISNTMKLSWDSNTTLIERIQDICKKFSCESTFSFEIQGLNIAKRYLEVYKKRGYDTQKQLRVGKELDNITVKRSIANIATSIYPTGKNANDVEITLNQYHIPSGKDEDGDFEIFSGGCLRSNKAYSRWAKSVGIDRHIYKEWTCEEVVVSQDDLYDKSVEQLKKIRDPEVNYEVSIVDFPDELLVGDRVNLIDDAGEVYISGRILQLETSFIDETREATIGDYLIKNSGMSDMINKLSEKIEKVTSMYTWIAYADDGQGTNVSLDPDGKSYLGIAPNQETELTNVEQITDLSIFKWSASTGADGQDSVTLNISSSNGVIFNGRPISSILSAVVSKGLTIISTQAQLIAAFGQTAVINWYDNNDTFLYSGMSYTIPANTDHEKNYKARLEI